MTQYPNLRESNELIRERTILQKFSYIHIHTHIIEVFNFLLTSLKLPTSLSLFLNKIIFF